MHRPRDGEGWGAGDRPGAREPSPGPQTPGLTRGPRPPPADGAQGAANTPGCSGGWRPHPTPHCGRGRTRGRLNPGACLACTGGCCRPPYPPAPPTPEGGLVSPFPCPSQAPKCREHTSPHSEEKKASSRCLSSSPAPRDPAAGVSVDTTCKQPGGVASAPTAEAPARPPPRPQPRFNLVARLALGDGGVESCPDEGLPQRQPSLRRGGGGAEWSGGVSVAYGPPGVQPRPSAVPR